MAFFPEIENLMLVHSKFHLMFFIFPLVAFMFPQFSSYFLQFYLSSFIFLFKIQKLSIIWKIVINMFGNFEFYNYGGVEQIFECQSGSKQIE